MHSCSPIVQTAENSTKKPQNSCSQAHPQKQTSTRIPSGFCTRFISICVSLSEDKCCHYYRPQLLLRKGYVFIGVCLSTGGRCTLPLKIPPPRQTPPPGRRPPGRTPPLGVHWYPTGTHPTGMHSCLIFLICFPCHHDTFRFFTAPPPPRPWFFFSVPPRFNFFLFSVLQ